MRKLQLTTVALVLLFSVDSRAVWSTREIHVDRSETVVLELGGRVPQGVVLAKTLANGKPSFTISLFNKRSAYNTTPVPRGVFIEHYLKIRDIMESVQANRRPAADCPHSRIALQRQVAGVTSVQTALCESSLSQKQRESLGDWYREILKITGQP